MNLWSILNIVTLILNTYIVIFMFFFCLFVFLYLVLIVHKHLLWSNSIELAVASEEWSHCRPSLDSQIVSIFSYRTIYFWMMSLLESAVIYWVHTPDCNLKYGDNFLTATSIHIWRKCWSRSMWSMCCKENNILLSVNNQVAGCYFRRKEVKTHTLVYISWAEVRICPLRAPPTRPMS